MERVTRDMTGAEREAQRRSFVHGNVSIDNPLVTREMVAAACNGMARSHHGPPGTRSGSPRRAGRAPLVRGGQGRETGSMTAVAVTGAVALGLVVVVLGVVWVFGGGS